MRLCRALLRLLGWRLVYNPPPTDRYVAVGAWHTTNWDFPIAVLASCGMGGGFNFLGKRELTDGRLGWLMTRLGVIGIDRRGERNVVQQVAERFAERERLRLIVPAEGTRGRTDTWRSGFYYMALEAGVPIAFSFIDARSRTVGIDGYFTPSGDREADLEVVRRYYLDKAGIKPDNMGPIRFGPPREPR